VVYISAWQSIVNGFDFTNLVALLLGVIPALICITLHELSHGLVAWWLGDDTAKLRGRLSLNPLKHLDWMGFAMLVIAHVGWAKPVPVDMYKFRDPKRGMALTALAGPVSNLLITVVFLFLFGLFFPLLYRSGTGTLVLDLLEMTAYLSLGLGLFNLLPIPPLDGSKVLFSLLSDEHYRTLMRYERYGMLLLIALAFFGVTGRFLSAAIQSVFNFFWPVAEWAARLSSTLFVGK